MENQNLIINGENIQGMNCSKKRQEYFSWLKYKTDRDLTIVTETKCHNTKDRSIWANEWSCDERDSYWSIDIGDTGRKGVTILVHPKFNKKTDTKITHTKSDKNGRWVKIIVSIGKENFRILGIYAPNNAKERVQFFLEMGKLIDGDNVNCETTMGGDYNCTLNSELDRFNCISKNNDIGQKELISFTKKFELEDIWRIKNPKQRNYTWFGKNKGSRIDFWLISKSLNRQIQDVNSYHNPYSDHHGIQLNIQTKLPKIGKGIWKMNNTHILEPKFKEEFTKVWQDWQLKKEEYEDLSLWWDLGKIKIKEYAKMYAIEQSILRKSRIEELEMKITQLENTNNDNDTLIGLKNELSDLLQTKHEGARIRSRIKWWEEGEKSSKYFHDLERKNGKDKSWESILDEDKQLIFGTKNIQKRQVRFYKELFTSEPVNQDHSFFLSNPEKQLPKNVSDELEAVLNNEEVIKSIRKMKNDRSPGEDGITTEFYKTYWNLIGNDLCEVLRFGLDRGEMSFSQYLAIITLLYKKDQRENIKNWRPISLLNVDYKILSKVLAERLKKVLPYIIHGDQKGCIAGRNIGENIRLIEDLIYEIDQTDSDSVIFLQDDEKAYDRVEWHWLFSTLEYFGFGNKFINWLKIIYKHPKSSIMTNGHQSEYFSITRGIRQGDSLSALMYIIQMEPLAEKIRKIDTLKGITINLKNMNGEELEIRGCQYVDDSTNFLHNKYYISQLISLLRKYEQVSGSKVNRDKTVALIRKIKLKQEKINEIKLVNGPEKALGVPIGGNDPLNHKLWSDLINKMKIRLQIWQRRNLSLVGKTYIIRSIGVSTLLYTLNVKTIEDTDKKEIEKIMWNFLWSGKTFKFNRRICTLPRRLGGLNLVDINILEKTRRINWVIKVLKENKGENWSKLVENYLRCLDNQFGIKFFALKVTDSCDLIKKAKIPKFYKECIISFQELLTIAKLESREELIWCNKKIRFRDKPLSFAHWARDKILRPSQLYRDGILFLNSILEKLTHKAGYFFERQTIKDTFPEKIGDRAPTHDNGIENDDKTDILNYFLKVSDKESKQLKDLQSKEIYNIFLLHNPPEMLAKTYWATHAFPGHSFDWDAWGQLIFTNPVIPNKVKDHAFHIFHGTLYLEARLRHFKHNNGVAYSTGLCKACEREIETLNHFLIECQYRKKIWSIVQNVLNLSIGGNLALNKLEILTGYFEYDHDIDSLMIINMVLAMTRYQLWLIRNDIKHNNTKVSFQECYLRLKYYLLGHIKTLQLSSTTKQATKNLLESLVKAIETTLRNNLSENDF